jgi:hypothetical protein
VWPCNGEFRSFGEFVHWFATQNLTLFVPLCVMTTIWFVAHLARMWEGTYKEVRNTLLHGVLALLHVIVFALCISFYFAFAHVEKLLSLGNPMTLLSLARLFNPLTLAFVHILSTAQSPPIGIMHSSFASYTPHILRAWVMLCTGTGLLVEAVLANNSMYSHDTTLTRAASRLVAGLLLQLASLASVLHPPTCLFLASLGFGFACHVPFTSDVYPALPGESQANIPLTWFWRGGYKEPLGMFAIAELILSLLACIVAMVTTAFAAYYKWFDKHGYKFD